MHEEILKQHKDILKPTTPNLTNPTTATSNKHTSNINYRQTETTLIFRIFGGLLRNELKCNKCNYSSKTYNSFLDLSLEVGKGVSSLLSALKAFTVIERLSVGNEWNCEGCKKKVQV